MSTSPYTLRLYSRAHSLGDNYYRQLTTVGSHGFNTDADLKELALTYLDALEELLSHLTGAKGAQANAILKKRTQKYIELVRRDLQQFGEETEPTRVKGHTG